MAVSFVQKGADIQELIDIMDAKGMPKEKRPLIIPKIEKPAALKNIDEILALSDGLMVARGDLGTRFARDSPEIRPRLADSGARRPRHRRPPRPRRADRADGFLSVKWCAGDMGRHGETWEMCSSLGIELWGDMGRYGEIWGDVLEIWGDCIAPTRWGRRRQGGEGGSVQSLQSAV